MVGPVCVAATAAGTSTASPQSIGDDADLGSDVADLAGLRDATRVLIIVYRCTSYILLVLRTARVK